MKDIKWMIWVIVLAVAVLTYIGWDMFLNHPFLLANAGRLQSVGNYDLSNSFALLLATTYPLCFFLMESERNILKKIILFSISIIFFLTCFFTKSRGGSLGMLFGTLLCFMFSAKLVKSKFLKIVFVVIIFIFFLGYGVNIIMTRSDVKGYIGSDSSAQDRLLAWVVGFRMLKDRPFLGVGWDSKGEMFVENVRKYGHDKPIIAHNTPLAVLFQTGILGFIVFISVWYHILKQLWLARQAWKNNKDKSDLFIMTQGILISFICFIINSSFSVKDHDPIYWAILGLAGVMCGIYQNDKIAEDDQEVTMS